MAKLHDEPSAVEAFDGHVLVDGPGGVAITLTPEAAAKTGEQLLEHAAMAQDRPTTADDDPND